MHTMKTLARPMTAVVLTAGLAGCWMHGSSEPYDASADGVPCGSSAAGPVYIDIDYDNLGMPIDPGDCSVVDGTQVTWRGPDGEPVGFKIQFKSAAPLASRERGELSSVEYGGRYKVVRKINGPAGRYAYAIKANGKVLDPAIIIRPN